MSGKAYFAVGVDAGATTTRIVICLLENSRVRLLALGKARSEGWTKSHITDQAAVASSIATALREAERAAGVSVDSAVVGVGGAPVRGANCRGVMELGHPREVDQRDVNRVMDRASRVRLQEDRMVLQMFPQDFVLDGHPGHRDPRRMLCSTLEANVHLITASSQEHNTLVSAVSQAHLSVEETVFEPLAACYAAILPDDRREGIALVDIGGQSTNLAVYYGDSLQLATGLAVSGDHFTRDVARGLCTGFDEAQMVKHLFGNATLETTAGNSFVEVPVPGARTPREARRFTLNQILEARAEELFDLVRREVARVGMDGALIGGVVLTGGGAKLHGVCDVAERVLGCQSRNGIPIGIAGWPEKVDDFEWTTAAGLAMYSGKLKIQGELERQSIGLLARILR